MITAHADPAVTEMSAGGTIVSMPISIDDRTVQSLGHLLQELHERFGAEPELGAIETDRSGEVVVADFTTKTKDGSYSGLATVGVAPGEAVALYDIKTRFAASEPVMLGYLQSLYAPGDPVPELKEAAFADQSGSVALPDGWKLVQSALGYGAVRGPHGESIVLGLFLPIYDPANPNSAKLIAMAKAQSTMALVAPYTADEAKAFVEANNALAAENKIPPPKIDITAVESPSAPGAKILRGTAEGGALPGKRAFIAKVGVMAPFGSSGLWGVGVSESQVDLARAAKEQPLVSAILASYRPNLGRIEQIANPGHDIVPESDRTRGIMQELATDPPVRESGSAFESYLAGQGKAQLITWSELAAKSAKLAPAPPGIVTGIDY